MMKVLLSRILFLAFTTKAAEIIVDDRHGEGDFTTIQAAIDVAGNGDTIIINPNSDSRGYREEVTVTTPNLTITGSKSGKRRGRTLKGANTKNGSSKKMKKKQERRSLKSGKSGGEEDSFPFDALDERGFPSLVEQPDCSDVFLDGCDDAGICGKTVLTISEPGVTIEHLFIRHGNIKFDDNADGGKVIESCLLGDSIDVVRTSGSPNSITISNNFFQGGSGRAVSIIGNSHAISSNLVVPCDNGIVINGDNGLITNNKLFGCRDDAIRYFGARGTITDNEIYHGDDSIIYSGGDGIITGNTIIGVQDDGIKYEGNDGKITDNYVSGTGADGIDYEGDKPTITHNIVEFAQAEGINVTCSESPTCTGGTVSYNKVIGGANDDEGILIDFAKDFLVEYNTISYFSEIGLEFEGDGSIIRGNLIARGGTEFDENGHAMEVNGDDNIIEDNEVNFNTFDGINQSSGHDNVYRRNTINGNGRAGIRVEDGSTGTVISDNTIFDNQGEGIAVEGGTTTEANNNEASDNRVDICNNQDTTTRSGNTFTTGGFSTACELGLS